MLELIFCQTGFIVVVLSLQGKSLTNLMFLLQYNHSLLIAQALCQL